MEYSEIKRLLKSKNKIEAINTIIANPSRRIFECLLEDNLIGLQDKDDKLVYSDLKNFPWKSENNDTAEKYCILLALESNYNNCLDRLRQRLKYHHLKYERTNESVFKSYLSYLEYMFYSKWDRNGKRDFSRVYTLSMEEIAESISFIIFQMKDIKLLENHVPGKVSLKYLKDDTFKSNIDDAFFLIKVKEFELKLRHFKYTHSFSENTVELHDPKKDAEFSIRLGYIRTELQGIVFSLKLSKSNAITLYDMISKKTKAVNTICELTNDSVRRIRMKIPIAIPIFRTIKQFIKDDQIFKEEYMYLMLTSKESLLSIDEIMSKRINADLTIKDYYQFIRLIYYQTIIFRLFIKNNSITDIDVLLYSFVPLTQEQFFKKILSILMGRRKALALLNYINTFNQTNNMIDLQYMPSINYNGWISFLPFTAVGANYVRNIFNMELKKSNKNFLSDGTNDTLINLIVDEFSKLNVKIKSNLPVNFAGQNSDIDLCIHTGSTLYLIECKNFLLPVSIFDWRNPIEYIEKAQNQLDVIKSFFENTNPELFVKQRFSENLQVKTIKYLILTNSRLFAYSEFTRHPVRSALEFLNIVISGTIQIGKYQYKIFPEIVDYEQRINEYISSGYFIGKIYRDSIKKSQYEITIPPYLFKENIYSYSSKIEYRNLLQYLRKMKCHRSKIY